MFCTQLRVRIIRQDYFILGGNREMTIDELCNYAK